MNRISSPIRLYLLILVLATISISTFGYMLRSSNSSRHSNDEEVSSFLQNKYQKDATRLALRIPSRDFEDLAPDVPETVVESIYQALLAVHRSGLPAARLVTQTHQLHTFPVPGVDRFFVVYKKDASWAAPLQQGAKSTYSPKINRLLSDYGLVIDKHVAWDDEHSSFNVRATRSLNMAPLANQFLQFPDIVKVDLLLPAGGGNDIEIREIEDGWELKYIIKFEACISGCRKARSWTFSVREGKVSFLGESGDMLPNWMMKTAVEE